MLDKYVFKWCHDSLINATPDQIVEFYVKNFVFKNGDYLQVITEEYNLPNDILKMHTKIVQLAIAQITYKTKDEL